jgi:hypothetical protein
MATMISGVPDPVWPPTDEPDADRFLATYDRLGNTPYVPVFGRSLPGVTFPVDTGDTDDLSLRGDVETGQVVGFRIGTFLSDAVERHPVLVDLLDAARLRGITPAEVTEARRGPRVGDRRRATGGRWRGWSTRRSRRSPRPCRRPRGADGRPGRRAATGPCLAGSRQTVAVDPP